MLEPTFVEFATKDGLMLPGLLYKALDSNKVMIYLHGNGSSSIFYDEAENRDLPQELTKKGITLLKFNNRGAHIIKKLTVKIDEQEARVPFGMAYEKIKDCIFDIDGAVNFLKGLGYKEFYLAGASTGANKICVYNHYKHNNIFKKYILICGGDDTGIYNNLLGNKKFLQLLEKSKLKIERGEGLDIVRELLSKGETFSYQGFYDIANPDGDYNCFPFSEAFGLAKLSKKPLFRYYKEIEKDSYVVYGGLDEYSWGNLAGIIATLRRAQPKFTYQVIKGADHRFTGKKKELAKAVSNWI